MKKLNLIERLWTDSHEKQSPQRFGRYAAMLIMLLTLGVGQMWADDKGFYEVYMVYDKNGTEYNYTYNGSNGSMDLGTITSSFKIKKMYLKVWDTWGDQAFEAGSSGLGYKTQSGSDTDYKANNRTSKSDNNYELQHTNMNLTIASNTNPSGNYTFTHWWFADGTWTDTYYLKNGSSNCAFTYKIAPPAVKSSSVAISATNTAPGSGTGLSSGSPIILISGMASTLTITATQNHTDANSALWCKFGTGSYSSTTTYNIASGTTTSNQTIALGVKYRNNSASLDGTETTATIYYKWAAPAPAVTMTSVTPSTSIVAGNDITLVGTRANSSNTISFQYTTNDGGSWTDITPKTSSLSSNVLTATWTVPDAHGATQTFKFRAKLAEASPIYSSKSDGVTVYNTKTIHVKNSNNWGSMYVYAWDGSGDITSSWHGNTGNTKTGGFSCTSAGGQWWDVVITSRTTGFILNGGGSGDANQTSDLTYGTYTHDRCLAIGTESGKKSLSNTAATCPSAPSVTTASATSIGTTSVQFNASSVSANNDAITAYGFKWGTTSACSGGTVTASNLSSTTFSATKSSLTNGTTYYFKAYATNGQGTTYGDPVSVRTKFITTVTLNPQGGEGGTTEVTATEGSSMPTGKVAPTKWGYDFGGYYASAGGSGTKYYNANMSSAHNWDVAASTATIHAYWTAKSCTITLNNQGADSGKEGTTSVSTTYNTNTNLTSNITCPTKTGWKFQGYWSNTNGNGVQVIAADGSWISTVSGYMYEGKWVADGSATLYAYWVKASTYTFRYGTSGSEDWNGTAFTQVGATTTWQIENFTIPSTPNFYVGYEGLFYESGLGTGATKSKSVTRAWTDAPTAVSETYQGQMVLLPAGPTAGAIGQATGATGTLKIYSDSKDHNLYVGFEPSGYGVTRASGTLEFVNSSGTWRETNVVTLNSSDASGNFQVKLKTSSSYVATSHGTAENATAVNGRKITGDADIANGKKGVFQMWTDATTNNFGLRFVTVHDVTFDMQGHGDAISKYTDVRYGNKISAPSDPSASGYVFGGWYKDDDCTDDWDFANDVVTEATTLHAKWTPNTYTITLEDYDPDTWGTYGVGECATKVDKFVVTYGTNYFECYLDGASQPIKLPYDFNGWCSGEGGAGDEIVSAFGLLATGATAYTNASGKWNHADDVTIYAKWTLTLSGYSEIEAETGALYSPGTITFTYNSASTSAFTAATRTGYILDGYYTAEDGDKVVNADGTLVANVTGWTNSDGEWIYSMSSTPSLYTKWTPITYTVAFDKDNIAKYVYDAEGSMDPVDATYDEYVTMPANTFTREGYTFRGWSKTSDGSLFCLDEATSVKNLTSTQGATVTLYALWTGNTVTVSFNPREGSLAYCRSVDLHVGDTYGDGVCTASDLPEPTPPSGYVFTGWYTSSAGGTKVEKETIVTTTGDHTLYAHYAKQERIYFKNTLGWDKVYVTYDAYWNSNGHGGSNDNGTGNYGKIYRRMYWTGIDDIYYDVVPAAVLSDWKHYIAFNDQELLTGDVHVPTTSGNYENYNSGGVVYRMDCDTLATMFVPTNVKTNDTEGNYQKNTGPAQYYSTGYADGTSSDPQYTSGYWRVFNDVASGYVLTYEKNGTGSWCPGKSLNAAKAGDSVFVYTATLEANQQYNYNIIKTTKKNSKSDDFKIDEQINSGHCTNLKLLCKPGNGYMQTTVAGDYKFILTMKSDGHMYLTVEYPLAVNDYRVLYSYTKGSAQTFSSEYIKAKANAVDTISMFIHSGDSATARSLYIQKCTTLVAGVPSWNTTYSAITLPSETASGKTSGVYNFEITQDGSKAATGVSIGKYEGDYYIRCEAADGGWDQYKYRADNLMTFSEYSLSQTLSAPFSHYYCKYVGSSSTDITYTIATDYSPAICPIQEGDATIGGVGNKTLPSGHPASIRFTWNQETNATFRSYLKSAQGDGNKRFLVLHGSDNKVLDADGNEIAAAGAGAEDMHANELLFSDTENWVYELAFKAKPGAQVSIIARYNGSDRYLVGKADAWETIISGGADTKYNIAAVYDFKTNRLITTWIPSGTISDQIEEVDVLIERHNQEGATTITFGKAAVDAEAGSISAKRVIGALRFEYNELVGRVASWTPDTRAKMMFFVSFPFDVNVSDIFGLNTNYGEAFIVQGYNGAKRAEKGFFKGDGTDTFWETLPVDTVMHAGVGYVVTLDNDYFNGDVGHIWDNKRAGDHVYMYFPSANDPDDPVIINSDDKTINVPAHLCTINRTFNGGKLNHKYTDSNWNLMGVPIFQNHTGDDGIDGTPGAIFTATDEPEDTTSYANPENPTFGYFYEWHTDKTYTIAKADGFTFKPMHSYMVQYAGNVKFTCAEPTVPVALAPRRTAMKEDYNIELQVLNNNGDMLNHTYVELRENACDTFALNEDIYMMSNNKAASVYTFAGTYDVAANVLSIGSHVVPVGVIVKQAGTYTFTMPSNFSGTVTLIDTYADTRTNLALGDYEVNLPKGTFEDRFLLEININKMPTAIDGVEDGQGTLKDGKAHKYIENGQMYILQNGLIYDAQGKRVK